MSAGVERPASPCVGLCELNEVQVCQGCGRNLDEIAEWGLADGLRQRAIVEVARKRLSDSKQAGCSNTLDAD